MKTTILTETIKYNVINLEEGESIEDHFCLESLEASMVAGEESPYMFAHDAYHNLTGAPLMDCNYFYFTGLSDEDSDLLTEWYTEIMDAIALAELGVG